MKKYITPSLDIIKEILERNYCASFDSNDNTEIWTIEDEETI